MKPETPIPHAPAIWVDVTTLMHWQRPAVGIIRVEHQFCQWLLQAGVDVHFCRYDKYRKSIFRVQKEEVEARIRFINACRSAPANAAAPQAGRDRLLQLVKHIIASLPPSLGIRVRNHLIRLRPRINHARHRLKAAWQYLKRIKQPSRTTLPAEPAGERVRLAPGSVYVSMGLDWDYKNMADLYAMKQEQGFKCLFFCYDTIPVKLPHLCVADVSRQFAHYFADLAWTADRILCISDSSRRDLLQLMERLGVPAPDAARVHLGGDIAPEEATAAVSPAIAPLLEHPYLLFVSTIERRKNHEILYRAYTRLAEEGVELPRLIFVGMPGWGVQELLSDIHLDPRVQGLIIQLNHVNDADLAALYRQAQFTLYPSLYEGWGLPVAESLAFGKYCLCSSASSLPEVGQGFVDYLDPWDLPAWVDRLRFLVTHPEWVAERNQQIANEYRPHPWKATAAEIHEHARQLLETPGKDPASRLRQENDKRASPRHRPGHTRIQ